MTTDTTTPTIPYETKDLDEAAFIWCQKDARLVRVKAKVRGHGNNRPETFYFVFELRLTESELHDLMFAYANNETRVEPIAFCQKQTSIRDRLYSVKQKAHR